MDPTTVIHLLERQHSQVEDGHTIIRSNQDDIKADLADIKSNQQVIMQTLHTIIANQQQIKHDLHAMKHRP
jgi:hypothetical protein